PISFWQYRIDSWRADGATSGTEKRHAQQFWSRGSEVQLIMLRGEDPFFQQVLGRSSHFVDVYIACSLFSSINELKYFFSFISSTSLPAFPATRGLVVKVVS